MVPVFPPPWKILMMSYLRDIAATNDTALSPILTILEKKIVRYSVILFAVSRSANHVGFWRDMHPSAI